MDSKYTELEKWKQLKDSGDITEQEFNKEKQRILNSTDTISVKKNYKINYIMIIVIIINVILIIVNGLVRIGNIGEKEYLISRGNYNEKTTLKINELVINKGIKQLEINGLIISEDMYVVYEYQTAKQYIVFAYYNSAYKNTDFSKFYYMMGINAITGEIKTIESANKAYGKDYVISKALSSNNVENGNVGSFKYKVDYNNGSSNKTSSQITSQGYVLIALIIMAIGGIIYWRYKKTKRISTIISIIGTVLIIIQFFFILPYIHFGGNNYSNDTSDSSNSTSSITGIEQAIKDGKLKQTYMNEGITEGKLKVEYYEGELEKYYTTFEECLADAKELNIIVDSSKFSNLTGIERAIKDGAIGDDYMTNGVTEDQLLAALDGNLGMYYTGNVEQCIEDARKLNILKETGGSIVIGKTYKYSDNSCEFTITIIDDKRVKLDYTSYVDSEEPKTDMDGQVYPYETTYTVNKGSLQVKGAEGQNSYYINENGTLEAFGMIFK